MAGYYCWLGVDDRYENGFHIFLGFFYELVLR